MTLHVLPHPKDLLPADGTFSLRGDTLILIPALADDDAFFAACQLQDQVCQATCLRLPIVKAHVPPRPENAVLLICGPEQAAALGVEPVAIGAPAALAAQSYALTITPARAILYAETPTGLFYAVQTLSQMVRQEGEKLPALTICDWPTLPYRGLMLDISRRKVPTLATLKHLVRELSHYKLNVLQLYTEHTFQFPRHPKIGAGCGSLSGEDVLELDALCRQHHVGKARM